jgi:hypothetical protein
VKATLGMELDMNNDPQISNDEKQTIEYYRSQIASSSPSKRRRIFEKFALAALGSIPWVGGFISAAISLKTEEGGLRENSLQNQWLEEHAKKMERLAASLDQIGRRFENLGDEIEDRIQSEEYLDVVRKGFRAWDRADTDEKRKYFGNLVSNAAGTRLCSDDVVRLFIDWLDAYHESHFAVIREIYQNPGCSRYDIWVAIYGEIVREDSAEADLFKLLIRDLNTGGVIRQARETTADGRFLRKRSSSRRGKAPTTMESAFENSKPWVLTELGKQFVHYTMTELVPRVSDGKDE